jgi:hypothetical protein
MIIVVPLLLTLSLSLGVPAEADLPQQGTAITAEGSHHRVRVVVHVPRCKAADECLVTLFRYIIPTKPNPGTQPWAKAAFVRHHRAVFHVRRSRTQGLAFTFRSRETPYSSDLVLRWWHVKTGQVQTYGRHHRHRNEGGWCWAGTRKQRVDLSIRLQYIVADTGATPETVARVWLARAVKLTTPITRHNRMKQGVSFDTPYEGQRCPKTVVR